MGSGASNRFQDEKLRYTKQQMPLLAEHEPNGRQEMKHNKRLTVSLAYCNVIPLKKANPDGADNLFNRVTGNFLLVAFSGQMLNVGH